MRAVDRQDTAIILHLPANQLSLSVYRITSNFRRTFSHIFANCKLGCVLNSRSYFLLFKSLDNINFLREQVASLYEQ
jgi:hypothetical protein